MKNERILTTLIEKKKETEQKALEYLARTNDKVYQEFYDMLRNHDRDSFLKTMLDDLKSNIEKFWLNEKYNKDLGKSFNMIYLEHGGLYGGELEAYSINFNYQNKELPAFNVMDDRFEYLDNIECFPAFTVPILADLTENIQGKEDDFESWDDLMDIYELCEFTALVEIHETLKKASQENLFEKLNLERPFYFTVGEHDSGSPASLVYVIE